MQSGTWVDNQLRYDQLVESDRLTLSEAFKRAGWRTVGDVPSNNRTWPQGTSFYHYDKLYDRRNVGYRGPKFSYASMPDQYVFAALQRLELAKTHRRPLFAEVDLVSSHTPWTRIPQLIDWNDVGDGSIFKTMPVDDRDAVRALQRPRRVRGGLRPVDRVQPERAGLVRAALRRRRTSCWSSWATTSPRRSSPARTRATTCRSRSSPTTRRCSDQIAGWGWQDGLRPGPQAPVWPMDAFRDRFLSAFGS